MKKTILLSIWVLVFVLFSCSGGQGDVSMTKEGIIEDVKVSLINNLKNPKVSSDNDGNIFISSDEIDYTINPEAIIFGLIDEDSFDDAIVAVSISTGGNMEMRDYLVYLTGGLQITEFAYDPNAIFLKIENRIIYSDVPEYAEDDPRCCPSIHNEVKYQLIGKKIVQIY